jgi:1-pyrroline-5-carboxylate dehydrogenase
MFRLSVRRYASTFSLRYTATNEPILDYRRASNEQRQLETQLNEYKSKVTRIPCIIDGKDIWTQQTVQRQILPFDHQHVLAEYCYADASMIEKGIASAVRKQSQWNRMPIEQRANIFLKVGMSIFCSFRFQS